MNPCVRTVLNGAAPLPASESSSEDWNQPRCWSLPSRYMSACQPSECCCSDDSPSPLPSPAGRGRIELRWFETPDVCFFSKSPCCSSVRRIKTERDDEPESIQ